jgi:uncharacterized integral membrane protein
MDDLSETIILETDNIRITNRKAMVGWKTYEISKIMSVSLEEKNLSSVAGKSLVIISLITLVIGILSCLAALSIRFISVIQDFSDWPRINVHFLVAVVGLLFIYLGSIGWDSDKPTYIVQIETASGTSKILKAKDKDYVERIIKAINEAIARR